MTTAEKSTRPLNPLTKGNKVFIRTVTMYHVGRIVRITKNGIVLDDASWVADTGRLSEMLSTGKVNEVERANGTVYVGRGAIVDVYHWDHDLPVSITDGQARV